MIFLRHIYTLLFIVFWTLIAPLGVSANISLPWKTTFSYPECSQFGQGGKVNCDSVKNDGITWSWGSYGIGGNYTQVSSKANFAGGDGGNGFRSWVGDGDNQHSGPVAVQFPSKQKEIWIRWYQRYQAGFSWSQLIYEKTLYLRTDYSLGLIGTQMVPGFYGSAYILASQNTSYGFPVSTGYGGGWDSIMGGSVSDGQFHCYEIYIKMDTNSANGVGRLWIDGKLVGENKYADWSGGDASAKQGIAFFDFHNNQKYPYNGTVMYVDYDDFAIYNSRPPNTDDHGNPFIGMLNTVPPPSPPPELPPPKSGNPIVSGPGLNPGTMFILNKK